MPEVRVKLNLIIFYLFLSASISLASTFYVSETGDSGNGGTTWEDSWDSISDAVTSTFSGDTIIVKYGTYIISSEIYITSDRLIISDDGAGSSWENATPDSSQCIVDANQQIHIIEVNPRLSGSLIFSLRAGADLFNYCISLLLLESL